MSFLKNITRHCGKILSPPQNVQYNPVRHRYWKDKIARGPVIKDFGYKELIFTEGHLPRVEGLRKVPRPDYRPKNSWSENRALFGQNDYIDILGDGRLHPVKVSYNVPSYLRGVKGNEMQLLIKKRDSMFRGPYQDEFPAAWNKLNKRIKFLYKMLNRKTKTGFMKN